MKAFLSYSTVNKEFVLAVANHLGRQYSVVDARAFETGADFRKQILSQLDKASIFVLFASRDALNSAWVSFETDESWLRAIQGIIHKVLVYVIDSAVTLEEVPLWLKKALIKRTNSAKQVAREVRQRLDELLRDEEQKYFYGRRPEQERLQELLMPTDGSTPPRAFSAIGLPGIGRRTLIRHIAPDLLNLNRFVTIKLEDSISVHDLAIELASQITPFNTVAGFKQFVDDIRTLSPEQATFRTLEDMRAIVRGGELPIFVDSGGLIDEQTGRLGGPMDDNTVVIAE